MSGVDPFKAVEDRASLKVALNLMKQWRVHRIPVLTGSGELETLLTQSHVIRYIYPYVEKEKIYKEKISDLEFTSKKVVSVRKQDFVKDAFKKMKENRISGVAVVNEKDEIVGNISASDLKVIGYDKKLFTKLFLTVEKYLELIPQNDSIPGPICVNPSTTFEELLTKIVQTRVHRVYVVGLDAKLIGVISLTDIIHLLF